ncbi:MAG: ABC transporter ATP-binding protein [Nonlabens ulvanivorans]|uniref:ABC transporter n=1 Tax=Nonlabens ulvanivorans TaxID=906888 RepID=A0A081DCH1_NONUL|nr:ABC transporter ATP-binding protein [Nonlabens ulvanivorans]KEZ94246.1 multidrug ABC transporter ATPase [Nonlabens ulvanivorans]PRX13236.1 ABC-type multidrug transport system ATPase subunit [Nonlabens ulvanivorans]WOI21669.1 ABC transporter ATP-binding protein [Nonlabens ulvanivorans]GAK76617.1 ABC transporter [Nonlabens ulvanivorans]GAL00719.1 ABC transporter ATP-binding protein [Nonlabens ulvanivorans]
MILSLKNVSKTYPNGVKALDNVTININAGMFGLLGPNGAGKSSMMRTIATLQSPDSGSIHLDGLDILNNKIEFRKTLGYLPQEFGVYPKMSAHDLLHYFASLKGITSKAERNAIVDKALEVTNLSDVRNKHVAGYSGGMKQRFGIAQLLLNDPKLIIVDEPTAGLDPAERHRFLNVLREIGTNHIVIFSTHIVDDVKELCTDMAILNGGKILAQATPKQMTAALAGKIWTTTVERDGIEQMQQDFNVISSNYNEDNKLNVRVYGEVSPGDAFAKADPTLEDVYFTTLSNDKFIAATEIA